MELETLLQILSGGSDLALIAIAYAIWKIERRVFIIETKLGAENE